MDFVGPFTAWDFIFGYLLIFSFESLHTETHSELLELCETHDTN